MSTADSKISHIIDQLEWLIQLDLENRGIHTSPGENLCTSTQGNLYRAIKFLAENPGCQVGIATGFYIPNANPPAPENDGPPGALFLARGLNKLGYSVILITDRFCQAPLQQGIELFKNQLNNIDLIDFPVVCDHIDTFKHNFFQQYSRLRTLIAIERIGPSYTIDSFLVNASKTDKIDLEEFKKYGPGDLAGQCLNMNAIQVTNYTAPIYQLFEREHRSDNYFFTIGIGDGGNEIGMGSIPWQVIAKNITNGLGGKIACRVPADATIVAGVSNWAGYAVMAGLYLSLNRWDDFLKLYSSGSETKLIETYYHSQSAVDGKLGYPAMSVDGIAWNSHLEILNFMKSIVKNGI